MAKVCSMLESCQARSPDWDGKSSTCSKSHRIRSAKQYCAPYRSGWAAEPSRRTRKAGGKDRTLKYVVRDLESLTDRVIPFCDGKLVVKREALDSFKDVLARVRDGDHLTAEGLLHIVDIAYAMNTKTRRVSREAIQAAIQGRGILTGHTPDSLS